MVGGGALDVAHRDLLRTVAASLGSRAALVVAADSGVQVAADLDLAPQHIVGDLDSVDPSALEAAVADGAVVHSFARDKDATDLELALDLVDDLVPPPTGAEPVALTLIGPGGGRLDHLLADLMLMAAERLVRYSVSVHLGSATATVITPVRPRDLSGRPGEVLSLLPLHGTARGISTTGLRWPLVHADLVPGTTRGISNAFLDEQARVTVASGVVLAIQPGVHPAPVPPRTTPYDPSPRA